MLCYVTSQNSEALNSNTAEAWSLRFQRKYVIMYRWAVHKKKKWICGNKGMGIQVSKQASQVTHQNGTSGKNLAAWRWKGCALSSSSSGGSAVEQDERLRQTRAHPHADETSSYSYKKMIGHSLDETQMFWEKTYNICFPVNNHTFIDRLG